MGQILHGSAKTTHVVRAAIQRSKATTKELAEQYDINKRRLPSGAGETLWTMCGWGRRSRRQRCLQPKRKRCV